MQCISRSGLIYYFVASVRREKAIWRFFLSPVYICRTSARGGIKCRFLFTSPRLSRVPLIHSFSPAFTLPPLCICPSFCLFLSLSLPLFSLSYLLALTSLSLTFLSLSVFCLFFFLQSIKLAVHSSEPLARFSYAYRDTRLVNSPRAMYRAISARFIAYLSKYNVEK